MSVKTSKRIDPQLLKSVKFFQFTRRCFLVLTLLISAKVLIAQDDDNTVFTPPLILDLKQALKFEELEDWGVQAELTGPDGYVEVEVLALPANDKPENESRVILFISSKTNNVQNYHRDGWYVYDVNDEEVAENFEFAMLDRDVHDKVLSDLFITENVLLWKTDQYKRALARVFYWQKGFVSVNTDPNLNVVLKITAQNAVVHKIRIPGMDPMVFTRDHDVEIDVYSYSDRTLFESYKRKDITSLNLNVGDSVVFKTEDRTFTVEGLKDIWLARSGGESKYYHVPERMGGFKPFLGFDHQVHGVALREHPDHNNKQYPTIEPVQGKEGHYSYYWIAKGHVQSGLSTDAYDPTSAANGNVTLEKFKDAANFPDRDYFDIGGGETVILQRNNQKEGLNMELMEKWDPKNFDQRPWYKKIWNWSWKYNADDYKIVSGLDGDEIVLLEQNTNPTNPVGQRSMLQKPKEDWKKVLEAKDENDAEGMTVDPIEIMITYYQRNRMKDLQVTDPDRYDAWNIRYGGEARNELTEIWDQNQYQYDPNVTTPIEYFNFKRPVIFNDNTSAPIPINGSVNTFAISEGYIFNQRYDEVALDLKVGLPGDQVKPFYNISGEGSPSMFEQGVPYTVDLTGVPVNFRNRLIMEYTFENGLGHLETDGRSFPTGLSGDNWTEAFDIKGSGYHEITLYYQHGAGEKVILAGKELMEIQLRFLSVPGSGAKDFNQSGPTLPGKDLKEGRGEGDFWYLRDYRESFRNVVTGVHPEEIGRTKAFPYVFAQGDEVTFNIMDADPHTFLHYTVDFYLSERFMSKRLDDQKLAADIQWHLSASPTDYGPSIGNGRYLTHAFDNAGTYYLTATYRGAHRVKAQVIVKSGSYAYDKAGDLANAAEQPLGKIHTRALTRLEKDWLELWAAAANGGTTPNLENIQLAEVGEVYSMFTYNEGPRAQEGIAGMTPYNSKKKKFEKNRYGPQNDYNTDYEWSKSTGFTHDEQSILSLSANDLTLLAEPYENWFPSSWILHYMPGPDPKLISDIPGYHIETNESTINTLVKSYFDEHSTVEPWQVRLPWVSQTQWKGYRTRTNIKALNKLSALFDDQNGAFSGKAWGLHEPSNYENYVSSTNNVLPAFDDSEKDSYDFYWGLQSGRLKLIHEDDLQTGTLTVKVKNPATTATPTTFIAKYQTPGELPTDWMAGADMSSIPNLEAKGISWGYGQTSVDPYELISDYGMNTVRLRLWVDPVYELSGNTSCEISDNRLGIPYEYSSYEEVKTQIQRAKVKGLRVLLDLHLSDTWTDPGANIIPEAWKSDGAIPSPTNLGEKVNQYVYNTLEGLHFADATPDYVQIGNETNGNILLSDKYEYLTITEIASEIGVSESEMNESKYTINWDRNASLLNEGLEAVQSFNNDYNENTKTMVHIAGTYRAQDWIKNALFNDENKPPGEPDFTRSGVGTDVIEVELIDFLGMSYYLAEAEPGEKETPNQPSVTPSVLSTIIADIKAKTGLSTVIVETAFPRTYDWSDCSRNQMGFGYRGQKWKDVQDGRGFPKITSDNLQKQWLLSLIDMLKNTEGGNGLLYWEPFWVGSDNSNVPTKDLVGSGWENMSFFTFENATPSEGLNLLAAGGGIEAFCDGACPENLTGVVANKLAIIGNLGCKGETSAEQVNSLIKNGLKSGTILTLGNGQFPGSCSGDNDFYTSYGKLFEDHLRENSVFSVPGPTDYLKADGSHNGTIGEDFWLSFFEKTDTYYSFASNDVEYFVINTNNRVGPGTDAVNSTFMDTMKTWLENAIAASTKKYQIVLGHHSPHLTGHSSTALQTWDFKSMGADMYISSGANFYERHDVNGIPFVNVGLGGQSKDQKDYSDSYPATMVPGTHYAKEYGVLSALAGTNMMMFQFINVDGEKIDQFYLINRDDEEADRMDTYYLQNRRGTALSRTEEALDVWLILGQSNAEGRCESNYCYDEYSGDEIVELTNTFLLNEKGTFEQAKNALARYSSVGKIQFTQSIGFGWTFAQTLNSDPSYGSTKIGLVVNPIGGTDLEEWMPEYEPSTAKKTAYGKFSVGYGGENLYHETLRRIHDARLKYPNLNFRGVIWSQGENDAQRINRNELNYAQKAREIFNSFKADIDQDMIFLIPEVSYRPDLPVGDEWSHARLNEAYHNMADLEADVFVASVAGMHTFDGSNNNTQDTGVHWDHDSYRTIGVRLANLFLSPVLARTTDENTEVSVTEEFEWSVMIFPNPVTSEKLNIQLDIPAEGIYHLSIIGLDGKEIIDTSLGLNKGANHTFLSVESIPSGTYLVRITGELVNYSERVIITH